jgi:hypothetical protein
MSLPVSLLDYSIGKMGVVLATYLIPWSTMFALTVVGTFVLPEAQVGKVVLIPAIFLFLFASFLLQLAVAVVSESIGITICVMVAGNVLLNVFLMKITALPEVKAVINGDQVLWPSAIVWTILESSHSFWSLWAFPSGIRLAPRFGVMADTAIEATHVRHETAERLHYLDNLRAIAMLLGVFLHAGLAYAEPAREVWLATDPRGVWRSTAAIWFIHLFRMSSFFLSPAILAIALESSRRRSVFQG